MRPRPHRDGAAVTLMGRTESTLQEAAARIRVAVEDRANPKVDCVVGDATRSADVEHAVAVTENGSDGLNVWSTSSVGPRTRPPFCCSMKRCFSTVSTSTSSPRYSP